MITARGDGMCTGAFVCDIQILQLWYTAVKFSNIDFARLQCELHDSRDKRNGLCLPKITAECRCKFYDETDEKKEYIACPLTLSL